MASVNTAATHKFVIVLNSKSPIGKLLSATGQLAMSLRDKVPEDKCPDMSFISVRDPQGDDLISLSTCSFIVLKGSANQLLTLYGKAKEQGLLCSIFTSTMSYNGLEEDLIEKTARSSLDQVEPYGVGLFGKIEEVTPLTKRFNLFKLEAPANEAAS